MTDNQDNKPDVVLLHHGSLVGVWPQTDAAKDWIAEHVQNDAQWLGPQLMVEPRYVDDLINGMVDDGLMLHVT